MPHTCQKCGRTWDDDLARENDLLCTRKCGGVLSPVTPPESPQSLPPSSTEPLIPQDLPSILAIPLSKVFEERHPVMRLHRLCDAMEILTRFGVIVALGEGRRLAEEGALPESLLTELQPRIERPTFGQWRDMLVVLHGELEKLDEPVVEGLPGFISETMLPTMARGDAHPESSIIQLRNDLVHGGAVSSASAREQLAI